MAYDADDPRNEYDPYQDPYFGNKVMRDLSTYFVNGEPVEDLLWAIRWQMRLALLDEKTAVLGFIPSYNDTMPVAALVCYSVQR